MGRSRWLVVVWIACVPAIARAQTVEISPVGGYRFGGGFFERVTQQEVDLDGAPSVGVAVNVYFTKDSSSRRSSRIRRLTSPFLRVCSGPPPAGASPSTTTRPAVCRSSSTAAVPDPFSPGSSG